MPSTSTNAKSEGRAIASSTKAVVGNAKDAKGELSSNVAAPVQAQAHIMAAAAATSAAPSSSSPISSSPSAKNGPGPSAALPHESEEPYYTEEETLLRQYSRDIYAYTLTLYNAQRIDNVHRGRAAALKRAISDIAIPMKAMAVGEPARV